MAADKRRRRTPTASEIIEALLLQGVMIPCFRCAAPFTVGDCRTKNIQREHVHEFGLEGPDVPANWRFSHYHTPPCHKIATFGHGATSAGSSLHRIAKAKRVAKGTMKPSPKIKSRGFAKGYRPMRSRPW